MQWIGKCSLLVYIWEKFVKNWYSWFFKCLAALTSEAICMWVVSLITHSISLLVIGLFMSFFFFFLMVTQYCVRWSASSSIPFGRIKHEEEGEWLESHFRRCSFKRLPGHLWLVLYKALQLLRQTKQSEEWPWGTQSRRVDFICF